MGHRAYRRKTLYEQMSWYFRELPFRGGSIDEETAERFFADVLRVSKELVQKTILELDAGEVIIRDRGRIYPKPKEKS